MKALFYALAVVATVMALFTAGCTQAPAVPPATTLPTQVTTPMPVTTAMTTPVVGGLGVPGPTEVLPTQYNLDFQITSNGDTVNPLMSVAIRGGNGINLDSQVDVSLTKPDGTTSQGTMTQPFSMGQQVVLPCSTTQNHVQIWVTAPQVGKVKVFDDLVPFRSINSPT
ncbi:MAG TPA: hypothetical protein VMC42_00340 [Methanoregulaceae archaeon]|nr:hypothetical protein [Methanoregulaceae archaeon]